jgi:uncharacterized membrane protein YraQ (UPF0718 family)
LHSPLSCYHAQVFIFRRTIVLKPWQFMLLTVLAAISLALVVANIVLFSGNREAQTEFSTRAQFIQQSQQVEPLYQGIVRNLAEISAKTNDPQISQLLAAQGITFTVNQPQAAEAQKPDAKGKAK